MRAETRANPIVPPRDNAQFAPIFVLATARSYSSVISTMLGQHPQLFGFPELKLFAYSTLGELEASLPSVRRTTDVAHRSPGLVRAVAELLFGDQSLSALAEAKRWICDRGHWSGENVFDVLMARVYPRVALEKSPEDCTSDDALRRLSDAYPRARFVHLIRHPVTAAASMRQHLQLPRADSMTFCVYVWYEINFRLMKFGATLPSDRYMRVRAEDVLNEPALNLCSIASRLGLRTDDDALEAMRHPETSPFARFTPPESGVNGGNDREFLRDPIPHRAVLPDAVDPPTGWSGPASLWAAVVELASSVGY